MEQVQKTAPVNASRENWSFKGPDESICAIINHIVALDEIFHRLKFFEY